jgi:SAM-dependent MidA family methyltransferase
MLSGAPARAIASWAARTMAETGCRDLIEAGPGEGKLAAEVLRALPFARRWRTRLHLVERSQPLREKQRALLGRRARWHGTLEAALDACGGRACIFSNELIDAFPVRRFRREPGGWSELFLSPGPTPAEQWLPARDLPPSGQFALPHADPRNPADAAQLDPAGAGGAFQVWELSRHAPSPAAPQRSR